MFGLTLISAVSVTVAIPLSAHAYVGAYKADAAGIEVNATRYQNAAGHDPGSSSTTNQHEIPLKYELYRWGGDCTSTHIDQTCVATSDPKCQQAHPDDKQNKWRAFDIFISYDGGNTYPTYPNNPDISKKCLNTVVLNKPERAPLDPQLVFKKATKLVPRGEWHPQPNGQAVVNKPVIVTVETDRDQTFKPFTLLGYHVEVKAHIDTYEWQYGDGTPAATVDWPGQDFNSAIGGCTATDCANYVNHNYPHPGAYRIQLTLHWRATYRADGGAWQPVPGNITTTSPAQNIQILNAHSQLVNGN